MTIINLLLKFLFAEFRVPIPLWPTPISLSFKILVALILWGCLQILVRSYCIWMQWFITFGFCVMTKILWEERKQFRFRIQLNWGNPIHNYSGCLFKHDTGQSNIKSFLLTESDIRGQNAISTHRNKISSTNQISVFQEAGFSKWNIKSIFFMKLW